MSVGSGCELARAHKPNACVCQFISCCDLQEEISVLPGSNLRLMTGLFAGPFFWGFEFGGLRTTKGYVIQARWLNHLWGVHMAGWLWWMVSLVARILLQTRRA